MFIRVIFLEAVLFDFMFFLQRVRIFGCQYLYNIKSILVVTILVPMIQTFILLGYVMGNNI